METLAPKKKGKKEKNSCLSYFYFFSLRYVSSNAGLEQEFSAVVVLAVP